MWLLMMWGQPLYEEAQQAQFLSQKVWWEMKRRWIKSEREIRYG